jgi:hypothetical protein
MRDRRRNGSNAISMMIVEQFGLAIIPLCEAIASGLISGMTNGTSGFMRNADELSMTTVPACTAQGANCLLRLLPAEKKAMSMPWNESSRSGSTRTRAPQKRISLPADFSDASRRSARTGNRRVSSTCNTSCPTAPVAPTIATEYFTAQDCTRRGYNRRACVGRLCTWARWLGCWRFLHGRVCRCFCAPVHLATCPAR